MFRRALRGAHHVLGTLAPVVAGESRRRTTTTTTIAAAEAIGLVVVVVGAIAVAIAIAMTVTVTVTMSTSNRSDSSRRAIATASTTAQAAHDPSVANRSTHAVAGREDSTIIQANVLLSTHLLPPARISVEQAQAVLALLIAGHLVLELATLLGEGTGTIVDPLVAVNLLTLGSAVVAVLVVVAGHDNCIIVVLGVGSLGDDVVDARLYMEKTMGQ